MSVHELAGKPAPAALRTNIPRLVSAYYTGSPDPAIPGQAVSFGTSGHRGTSTALPDPCSLAWIPTPSPSRR